MFLGIDPFSATAAVILAGLSTCAPREAPKVDIAFQNNPPERSNALSHENLGQFNADTQFSHGRNEVFITGGLTRSNIGTQFKMALKIAQNSATQESCVWIDNISVTVTYAPVVYIASNYDRKSCRYRETLLHETRHVNTDVITLNEHLPVIKADIAAAAAALGVQGPVPEENVKDLHAKIEKDITAALQSASDKMNAARMARQQLLDTRQEYLRLGRICAEK